MKLEQFLAQRFKPTTKLTVKGTNNCFKDWFLSKEEIIYAASNYSNCYRHVS